MATWTGNEFQNDTILIENEYLLFSDLECSLKVLNGGL